MRTESAIIFVIALILTVVIIGTVHYFYLQSIDQAEFEPKPATVVQNKSHTGAGSTITPSSYARIPATTSQPRKCIAPDGSEFYTNFVRCEDADLDNTLSVVDTVVAPKQISSAQRANTSGRQTPDHQRNSKPHLQHAAKSPPKGLKAECRFPVGKALEIERSLSAADDPKESIWKKSYCRFRKEVIDDGCNVSSGTFYYSYRELCW